MDCYQLNIGLASQPVFRLNPLREGKLPQLWPASLGTLCTHNAPYCIQIKFNPFLNRVPSFWREFPGEQFVLKEIDPARLLYEQGLRLPYDSKWANGIKKRGLITEIVVYFSYGRWKEIFSDKIESRLFKELCKQAESASKTKDLRYDSFCQLGYFWRRLTRYLHRKLPVFGLGGYGANQIRRVTAKIWF